MPLPLPSPFCPSSYSTQFRSESIFYSCCPSPSCRLRRRRRCRVSHTLDALCCAGWAPHRIVIFIYLAFCKRNFQWNLNFSAVHVVVVVVGFCVLFDAMSAVFNFNQYGERDSGRPNGGCLAGRQGLPAWTDAVSSSVVMLLSFCYAQLARCWFIFFAPAPPSACVCVWQQPQNHFTSLSFNKLYNIFNLKRNKINLLTIVEQSSASAGTPLSFTSFSSPRRSPVTIVSIWLWPR